MFLKMQGNQKLTILFPSQSRVHVLSPLKLGACFITVKKMYYTEWKLRSFRMKLKAFVWKNPQI